MGGIPPVADEVLVEIFKRAGITEEEYDHICSLIDNMNHTLRSLNQTNPYVIKEAALDARLHIKEEEAKWMPRPVSREDAERALRRLAKSRGMPVAEMQKLMDEMSERAFEEMKKDDIKTVILKELDKHKWLKMQTIIKRLEKEFGNLAVRQCMWHLIDIGEIKLTWGRKLKINR